ncbi:MAG: rhomboid family intramembrane serine protease [Actinomycetota bacterium]|nr:rhomboid family intramembrane serine protease [Actinomycetota bacterium]
MASGPDLFVVCKSCGSEVSPYITECPYCGTRLRKRAPKLDKGGTPKPPKPPRRRRPTPSLGRLRPGEIPGIRADLSRRPYATLALVVASVLVTLGAEAALYGLGDIALTVVSPLGAEYWKLVTTSFVYGSTGYQLAALVSITVFGWLLERRHGLLAPVLVYVLGAAAGSALAVLADDIPLAVGGNSAALALLGAWLVPELLERRRGEETEGDLLGVAVFAAVLLALPLATVEAHPLAGLGGAAAGLVLGLPLARLRRD